MLLLNTDNMTTYKVNQGDRIAQLVLVSLPDVRLVQSERLTTTLRDQAGFGSSGYSS